MGACDQCYRAKLRCSGVQPVCDRCSYCDSWCTYTTAQPIGRPKRNQRALSHDGRWSLRLERSVTQEIVDAPATIEPINLHFSDWLEPSIATLDLFRSIDPGSVQELGSSQQDHVDYRGATQAAPLIACADEPIKPDNNTIADLDPLLCTIGMVNDEIEQCRDVADASSSTSISGLVGSIVSDHVAKPGLEDLNPVLPYDGPINHESVERSHLTHCLQAMEVIHTLAKEQNDDPDETLETRMALVQAGTALVSRILEDNTAGQGSVQAILVMATLCHIILSLTLKKHGQLRREISNEESSKGTKTGDYKCPSCEPLMLGSIEIRDVQTRRRVFEALIEGEECRIVSLATELRARVPAWDADRTVSTIWNTLLPFGLLSPPN